MTRKRRALKEYAKHHRNKRWHVAYVWRNIILKDLGFDSYKDYLASDCWRSIRSRALKKNGGQCVSCDKKATQVHHGNYERETLAGGCIKHLYPVCRSCHKNAEIGKGGKRSIHEANTSLGSLSPGQIKYWDPGRKSKERGREANRRDRLARQRAIRQGNI